MSFDCFGFDIFEYLHEFAVASADHGDLLDALLARSDLNPLKLRHWNERLLPGARRTSTILSGLPQSLQRMPTASKTAVSAQAARHNPCLLVRVHEHAASLERDLTALNCNREQVAGNAGAGGAEEACEETYDPSRGSNSKRTESNELRKILKEKEFCVSLAVSLENVRILLANSPESLKFFNFSGLHLT
jgi:hypothetical protein